MQSETFEGENIEVSYITRADPKKRTDSGIVQNGDSLRILSDHSDYIKEKNMGYLFAVADGISRTKNPYKASSLATSRLIELYELDIPSTREPSEYLEDIIGRANEDVIKVNGGTTLSALYLHGGLVDIYHAGDSAIYRCGITGFPENPELTVDKLTNEHSEKDVLSNYIGKQDMKLARGKRPIIENDYFILGTDGIMDRLNEEKILSAVSSKKDTGRIVETLFENSKKDDDATLMVVWIKKVLKNERIAVPFD